MRFLVEIIVCYHVKDCDGHTLCVGDVLLSPAQEAYEVLSETLNGGQWLLNLGYPGGLELVASLNQSAIDRGRYRKTFHS